MSDIEILIDKSIDFAIDQMVKNLSEKEIVQPFAFLVHTDCLTSVVPQDTDYYLDDGVMLDDFKNFGNEKLNEPNVEGYSVAYTSKTKINENEMDIIVIFCKFKKDTLPLKTRMYYFPYTMQAGKPYIDFENAFASEG